MSNFKKCPFCGSRQVMVIQAKIIYMVRCFNCEARVSFGEKSEISREAVKEAWNRRTSC